MTSMPADDRFGMPRAVTLVEVGARDGFQIEATFIPTALKIAVIDLLSAAGVREIEVTSFVSPKVVPQMRDAAEVMAGITRATGVVYSVLVPNLKGAQRALDTAPDRLRVVIAATDAYNQRNLGRTVDASFEELAAIRALAQKAGVSVDVVFGLSFGCPISGPVTEARVESLIARAVALGLSQVALADSYGFANPRQVASLAARVRATFPAVAFSLHLHDTRGLGLANAVAGMAAGITTFDASVCGLGGAPHVEGATGNIASEDFLHLCDAMGVATGVDLDAFLEASRRVAAFLDRPVPSRVLASGTRRSLFERAAARHAV